MILPASIILTPENLYDLYKIQCKTCRHWNYVHWKETQWYHPMAFGTVQTTFACAENCKCEEFIEPTPLEISEWIEEYYKSIEEHKKLVLQ